MTRPRTCCFAAGRASASCDAFGMERVRQIVPAWAFLSSCDAFRSASTKPRIRANADALRTVPSRLNRPRGECLVAARGQIAGAGVLFLSGAALPALLAGQRRTTHERSAVAYPVEAQSLVNAAPTTIAGSTAGRNGAAPGKGHPPCGARQGAPCVQFLAWGHACARGGTPALGRLRGRCALHTPPARGPLRRGSGSSGALRR